MTRVETFCTTTQTNMDTIQLTFILRKDRYMRGVFQGLYPSDKLPTSVSSYPALFIANVDTSDKPGTHWVAFYFTKERQGEFLDSYGLPPSNYTTTFSSFLNNNSNSWKFNSYTLQSIDSKVCGHYCLYFALFRSRQVSMSTIVNRFSSNKSRSDFLVQRFIEKCFPISLPKYRTDVKKQRAIAQHNKHPCNFILTYFIE